jgi:hypothetical protein
VFERWCSSEDVGEFYDVPNLRHSSLSAASNSSTSFLDFSPSSSLSCCSYSKALSLSRAGAGAGTCV